MSIGKHEALQELTPNAKYIIRDNDLEWLDEDITRPTDEEINNKIAELETAYDNKQYQRDRADAYPSIQEQLDMQYWDSVNGTTIWSDKIAEIKKTYPKG
jgi:hypothetical protein